MTTQHDALCAIVFEEYRERIFGYMAGKNVPLSDRDDVFSEVLLKTARQAGRYDSAKASVSTWVYIITRSVVTDYFRHRKQDYPLSDVLPSENDAQDGIVYEEELKELAKQLQSLPERERRVIILRVYKDMSYCEIARELGVSQTNASTIYSRALGKLRKMMAT